MAEANVNASGTPQASLPVVDVQLLQTMLAVLLEEKSLEAAEKKEKRRVAEQRNEARQKLAQYNEQEEKKKQTICTHLKGGKGPKNAKVDYALYHHTFPDTSTYIRCQICGMKWRKGDTTELLTRHGKQVDNHTGIGWKEAIKMLSESTNTPTSSEIPMVARPTLTE